MRFVILFFIFFFLVSSVAFAQDLVNPLCPSGNPDCKGGSSVSGIIEKIVNWLIAIGGPIAVGMIIWGALQMVFAAGDPEKFKKGRQTIMYTVIGYAIILVGWGMTKIIDSILRAET